MGSVVVLKPRFGGEDGGALVLERLSVVVEDAPLAGKTTDCGESAFIPARRRFDVPYESFDRRS